MPQINFTDFGYVPILGVRPAEMQALEELPSPAKDGTLPYIVLQPWTTAKQIENVVARVDAAFGKRPIIVDVTEAIYSGDSRRPVHDIFDSFRDSSGGYKNWYDFVANHENYVPSLQLGDPNQLARQIPIVASLARGVVVRITEIMFPFAEGIADLFRGFGAQVHADHQLQGDVQHIACTAAPQCRPRPPRAVFAPREGDPSDHRPPCPGAKPVLPSAVVSRRQICDSPARGRGDRRPGEPPGLLRGARGRGGES